MNRRLIALSDSVTEQFAKKTFKAYTNEEVLYCDDIAADFKNYKKCRECMAKALAEFTGGTTDGYTVFITPEAREKFLEFVETAHKNITEGMNLITKDPRCQFLGYYRNYIRSEFDEKYLFVDDRTDSSPLSNLYDIIYAGVSEITIEGLFDVESDSY